MGSSCIHTRQSYCHWTLHGNQVFLFNMNVIYWFDNLLWILSWGSIGNNPNCGITLGICCCCCWRCNVDMGDYESFETPLVGLHWLCSFCCRCNVDIVVFAGWDIPHTSSTTVLQRQFQKLGSHDHHSSGDVRSISFLFYFVMLSKLFLLCILTSESMKIGTPLHVALASWNRYMVNEML